MPARNSIARKSDFHRFLRHVMQKHGRETASASMSAIDLAGVLDREGIAGEWRGDLAHQMRLIGRTDTKKLHEVFVEARIVHDADSGEDGAIFDLKSRFDSTTRRDKISDTLDSSKVVGNAEAPASGGIYHALIFGLPKSVSALSLSTDPAVIAALEAAAVAYRDAVISTLDTTVRCRSGRRGSVSEAGAGIIAATWIHRGSSVGDPHFHIHAALSNATWRSGDSEGRALDSRVLLAAKRLAEAAGLAAMEAALTTRLCLGPDAWTRVEAGSVIVPELTALIPVAATLARARDALAEREDDVSRTYAGDELRWRQQRAAMAATAGDRGTPEEIEARVDIAFAAGGDTLGDLQAAWRAQAGTAWPAAEAEFARQCHTTAQAEPRVYDGTIARAMKDLISRHSTPSFFDFAAIARSYGVGDAESLIRGAVFFDGLVDENVLRSRVRASPIAMAMARKKAIDTAALHAATGVGRPASITTAAVEADLHLQRRAEALAGKQTTAFPVEVPDGVDDAQLAAIQLAVSGRKLSVIAGVAGAGKTFSLKPVAEAAKVAGLTVISAARNSARARETGEGIVADFSLSLALLLRMSDLGVDRPVMIVLDEGGVVDRTDLEALLGLAEDPARRVQIVVMGDRAQAQSIDRSAAFASIERGAERAGGLSRLETSYRCASWAAEADDLRSGEGARVLDRVLRDGRLVDARTEGEAAAAMADAVVANLGSIAMTSTNEEAARISCLVQQKLGRAGIVPLRHGSKAAVGDRIRVRRNHAALGICNGDEFVVIANHADHIVVEGARGRVNLPLLYCHVHAELAYASTIDAAQGVTAARAIVRVDASVGRSKIYSAATRGREPPIFVAVGESGAATLAAAIARDDVVATAVEVAAAVDASASAPIEADARAEADAERMAGVTKLRLAMDELKATGISGPDITAAAHQVRGFYTMRCGLRHREADAQEVLSARRHAAVRALAELERDAAMRRAIARSAVDRLRDLQTRPRPASLWARIQARVDLRSARADEHTAYQRALRASIALSQHSDALKATITACVAGSAALSWATRDVLSKAMPEAMAAAAVVRESLIHIRGGSPTQGPQEKQVIPPRPEGIIQAEIEKVTAEAAASRIRMDDGLAAMRQAMAPDDPVRVAGEAYAIASDQAFRIRIEKLNREIRAARRATEPDSDVRRSAVRSAGLRPS